MGLAEHDFSYGAFISYRRSDGSSIAGWLRRHLQDFVLPRKLAEGRGKLRVYLDTAFERANEDFWVNNIEPALRASRYLIVVATPDALRPREGGRQNWVEREIEFFLDLPQGRNILVARAKGEFSDELPCRLLQRFPQVSIVDLRGFRPLGDRLVIRSPLREHLPDLNRRGPPIGCRFWAIGPRTAWSRGGRQRRLRVDGPGECPCASAWEDHAGGSGCSAKQELVPRGYARRRCRQEGAALSTTKPNGRRSAW